MAKAEYWQRGESIDFTNAGEKDIKENEIVVFGEHVGVAGCPIAKGETGSLMVTSVFDFPKDNAAIGAGASVYFIPGTEKASATKGSTGVLAGYAAQAAAAEDTTVRVKLLG